MTTKPKGLRLFDQAPEWSSNSLGLKDDSPHTGCIRVAGVDLDADQLDKLAERCKQWSKYLRSQKGKKPVVKKWEDL